MNLKQRVETRGWSMTGVSPVPQAPRNCARWNRQEESDLRIAFRHGLTLPRLCELFGRTSDGILCRLDELGLAEFSKAQGRPVPNYRTIASAEDNARFDFDLLEVLVVTEPVAPPVHPNCRSVIKPVTQGVSTVNLTANKLMLLLSIYRGTYANEMKVGTHGADLCHLQVKGLVEQDGADFRCTSEGSRLVDHLLDKPNLEPKVATSYSERGTDVLSDGAFYMVANGDVSRAGATGLGQPSLKYAPKVVQPTQGVAEKEAVRLAKAHPEQKFFVLKAVSVHQVTTPVVSTRL
jgi:hypothetical protein